MEGWDDSSFGQDSTPLSPLRVKKSRGEGELGSLSTIKIAREAARTSNQRAEIRRAAGAAATTVRFRGQDHPVRLLNLSSSGAMVESALAPLIGEPLEIRIGDGEPMSGVARWTGDGRIGIEFGSHSLLVGRQQAADFTLGISEAKTSLETIDEFEAPGEAQREPRQAVIRHAMVQAGTTKMPARLCNISSNGVMLESHHCLAPGSAVQIEMAGGLLITAKVRWSSGKRAGLSFDDRIETKGLGSIEVRPTVLKPTYLEGEFDPHSPWAARFNRLTMRELCEEPAPISDDDVPASWRRPAQSTESGE